MNKQETELIDKLYITYSRELYLIARHRLQDEEKAKDAVQTVFFIALLKVGKLSKHENKKLWLFQTMSNVLKQFLYDKKYTKDGRLREILTNEVAEQGFCELYEFENLGIIEDLKTVLREREYRYLIERFVNGRTHQEIANLFGITYSGATSLGDRVLKKVKKYLKKTGKNNHLN